MELPEYVFREFAPESLVGRPLWLLQHTWAVVKTKPLKVSRKVS